MSRTGGGLGANGHKIRGSAKRSSDDEAKAEPEISLVSVHDIELAGPCPVEHDDYGQKPARSGLCVSRAPETAVDAREDAGSSQPRTEASSAPARRGASPSQLVIVSCVSSSTTND